MENLAVILIKSLMAVVVGGLIGSERARHGRAAGMRTHVLVCLGSAMTSMTSLYLSDVLGNTGDLARLPAQVISGVGFLGAGMIILKSNNMITGLTTAAGVWATSAIGIAIGYGFYTGAVIVTVLFMTAIILLAKFERKRKSAETLYIEIDDMYRTNEILNEVKSATGENFDFVTAPPKSGQSGHLGINLVIERREDFDISNLLKIENVVYVTEE